MMNGNDINSQDEQGYSPLHAAVTYGHIHIVEHLLAGMLRSFF
jgi:ankyrin repeat protein